MSKNLTIKENIFSRCLCKWISLYLVRPGLSQKFGIFNALVHKHRCKEKNIISFFQNKILKLFHQSSIFKFSNKGAVVDGVETVS